MTAQDTSAGSTVPSPGGAPADGLSAGADASPLDTVAPDSRRPSESTIRIGLVLPDVMGTYGDDGNSLVLQIGRAHV